MCTWRSLPLIFSNFKSREKERYRQADTRLAQHCFNGIKIRFPGGGFFVFHRFTTTSQQLPSSLSLMLEARGSENIGTLVRGSMDWIEGWIPGGRKKLSSWLFSLHQTHAQSIQQQQQQQVHTFLSYINSTHSSSGWTGSYDWWFRTESLVRWMCSMCSVWKRSVLFLQAWVQLRSVAHEYSGGVCVFRFDPFLCIPKHASIRKEIQSKNMRHIRLTGVWDDICPSHTTSLIIWILLGWWNRHPANPLGNFEEDKIPLH